MELLRTMTRRIREEFTYSHRSEQGGQSPGVTLQRGSGTCRDFAWLMIDAVRSPGLAARFVSGYIFLPRTASTTVVGGGATHVWLQVYLPGAGWVDFDPTNSIIGNRNLVRVAWHPARVLPLWGTFTGAPGSTLDMHVDVTVTEELGSRAETTSRGME
jgi:transglutaminase-like putative cysteine protease